MALCKQTLLEDVIDALKELGGKAHLDDIVRAIEQKGNRYMGQVHWGRERNFKAAVRSIIYKHSSDSVAYERNGDYFYSVYGIRRGFWGLRPPKGT
jgi:hypothetical protein